MLSETGFSPPSPIIAFLVSVSSAIFSNLTGLLSSVDSIVQTMPSGPHCRDLEGLSQYGCAVRYDGYWACHGTSPPDRPLCTAGDGSDASTVHWFSSRRRLGDGRGVRRLQRRRQRCVKASPAVSSDRMASRFVMLGARSWPCRRLVVLIWDRFPGSVGGAGHCRRSIRMNSAHESVRCSKRATGPWHPAMMITPSSNGSGE